MHLSCHFFEGLDKLINDSCHANPLLLRLPDYPRLGILTDAPIDLYAVRAGLSASGSRSCSSVCH